MKRQSRARETAGLAPGPRHTPLGSQAEEHPGRATRWPCHGSCLQAAVHESSGLAHARGQGAPQVGYTASDHPRHQAILPGSPRLNAALQVLVAIAALSGTAPADTVRESAPAPLLVPGRVSLPETPRPSRAELARQQYEKGLGLERMGAAAAAIICYRRAVGLDSTLAGPNYRMGVLFQNVNQVGEAVRAFAAEVGKHPDDADAARELGLGLAQLNEHPRAIAQLESLTRRLPGDGANWRALGYAYMRAGRPRDAETALRRAIALPPQSALEHRDLGFVLAATGRESAARAEYQRAIALDPKETGAWVNLANLDRAKGDLEQALANFREAEMRDSTLALAVKGQAQLLGELKRYGEAGATYRRLLERVPGDFDARFAAVRLYEALGRDDIALEVARGGVRHDRSSGDARLLMGMALEAQGRLREAALELRRAELLARDPGSRERARRLIDTLNQNAPDSLRVQFAADSATLVREQARRPSPQPQVRAVPARADSQRTRPVMAVPPERIDSLFLPVRPDTK
jgi:tetratricopeptide (TPR) repeat protein